LIRTGLDNYRKKLLKSFKGNPKKFIFWIYAESSNSQDLDEI